MRLPEIGRGGGAEGDGEQVANAVVCGVNKHMPKIISTNDYNDFVLKIADFDHRNWVFRGHSEDGWQIESSLARHLRIHQKNILRTSFDARENDSIRKFAKSAHQFLSHLPESTDKLSWLAIMQHFGAPTRLIDFTYSPFVALYFAAIDAKPSIQFGEKLSDEVLNERYKPYEVHAVHLKSIREQARKALNRQAGEPKPKDYFIGDEANQHHEFLGFFEGIRHNPRQIAQQGLFLVPSKIDLDVQKILSECPSSSQLHKDSSWIIFRFPGGRESYKRMIYSLINANLTAESLFPGLEGVGRSIYQRWYQRRVNLP